MNQLWEHSWAVMWEHAPNYWHVSRYETEKEARHIWNSVKKTISRAELVEQYIQRDKGKRD